MVKEDAITGGDMMQQKHPFIWSSYKSLLLWKLKLYTTAMQVSPKSTSIKSHPAEINERWSILQVIFLLDFSP